jgi:hypothetical protein
VKSSSTAAQISNAANNTNHLHHQAPHHQKYQQVNSIHNIINKKLLALKLHREDYSDRIHQHSMRNRPNSSDKKNRVGSASAHTRNLSMRDGSPFATSAESRSGQLAHIGRLAEDPASNMDFNVMRNLFLRTRKILNRYEKEAVTWRQEKEVLYEEITRLKRVIDKLTQPQN